jgi:hypothetical protein
MLPAQNSKRGPLKHNHLLVGDVFNTTPRFGCIKRNEMNCVARFMGSAVPEQDHSTTNSTDSPTDTRPLA